MDGLGAMTSRTQRHGQSAKDALKERMLSQPHAQRRKQAVASSLAGDKRADICQQTRGAKSWLYKWKARYQADDPAWATAMSSRSKMAATQTPDAIEQAVVARRQTFAQSGQNHRAGALRQALKQPALKPVPSLRTIYRILQRHEQEGISINPHLVAV
jgi:putative transposase